MARVAGIEGTIVAVKFCLGTGKADLNEQKHGVSFREASTAIRTESMKKDRSGQDDELRPEYKRSDFGAMVRGKHASRLTEESNVVVLEPEVAKIFPNDKAVNEALRGLIKIAESAARPAPRRVRTRTKAD